MRVGRKIGGLLRMAGVTGFVFILAVINASVSPADPVPDVEMLGDLKVDSSVLWCPGRLAVGGDGSLFVVDGYKNHILKFDSDGKYTGDIRIAQVSAVASAPDGTLYIGSHKDYSVAIYQKGKISNYLGKGAGEFLSIRDIEVDVVTGDVYVVDNVDSTVKIYNASGKKLGRFAGLNLPSGVVAKGNEIYILDEPLVDVLYADGKDTSTMGRVVIYDKSGIEVRSFDIDVVNNGFGRPTDIAVGNDGNIYVTDATAGFILVFKADGQYVGEISNPQDEISVATSVALSGDGKLYISSSEKNVVQIFALKDYPEGNIIVQSTEEPPIIINLPPGNKPDNPPPGPDVPPVFGVGENIVVSVDGGTVKILDFPGNVISEFKPFDGIDGSLDNAVADVDGDGTNEIVVGTLNGDKIGVFGLDGSRIAEVATGGSGVVVSADDLNGDLKSEIIAVLQDTGEIKVFAYNEEGLVSTGISERIGGAVAVASGDLNGDGVSEIIAVAVRDGVTSINKFDVLPTKGYDGWSLAVAGEVDLEAGAASVTVKDVDNDGTGEIVIASGAGGIYILNGTGIIEGLIPASGTIVDIAVGDVNGDGRSDMIVGLQDGSVVVLSLEGENIGIIGAFSSSSSVRVSVGAIGGTL